jgi:hypothetical protein
MATRNRKGGPSKIAEGYRHPDQTLLLRPEVGTQAQFRKKKPPVTARGRRSAQTAGADRPSTWSKER